MVWMALHALNRQLGTGSFVAESTCFRGSEAWRLGVEAGETLCLFNGGRAINAPDLLLPHEVGPGSSHASSEPFAALIH